MSQTPSGIDPRGPRFGAAITSGLLLIVVYLGLDETSQHSAFWLLLVISVLFLVGATLGPTRHPYGLIYKKYVQPRIEKPTELEEPRPVRFAQVVGLLVTFTGLLVHIAGLPFGLVIAAAVAFVAAFLNAAFAYCLGCQLYLVLKRFGLLR